MYPRQELMISPTHRPPHVPAVDHGNLDYAGLDNKTPQKYTETIINHGRLPGNNNHRAIHRRSTTRGLISLLMQQQLQRHSVSGIGQGVRQYPLEPLPMTVMYRTRTVLYHLIPSLEPSREPPRNCPRLATFSSRRQQLSTPTAQASTSDPKGSRTRTSTFLRSLPLRIPRRPTPLRCWGTTSRSPSRPRPTRGVGGMGPRT